ncbi:MAG: hypothetical protein L3J54_09195 [Draconibacterium sp.]|nr:hypothetical protein [Draconibacterium sp.]
MKRSKFKRVLALLLLISTGLFAQQHKKEAIHKKFNSGSYAPVYLSYYGNLITHPGIKVGFDWNLLIIEKTKESRKRIKTIRKILLVTPSVAFYNHKASHKGLIISTDLAYRRYSKRLFYREIGLGLGYFRKFNTGETWEVNNDETVNNTGSSSRGYFAPALSIAFGKRFLTKNSVPLSVFTRANVNAIFDYDATIVPELSIELGVQMIFNSGVRRGKIKTVKK